MSMKCPQAGNGCKTTTSLLKLYDTKQTKMYSIKNDISNVLKLVPKGRGYGESMYYKI